MKRLYAIAKARFKRWWYLLTVGMWRGECAYDFYDDKNRVLCVASGKPGPTFKTIEQERIWWKL